MTHRRRSSQFLPAARGGGLFGTDDKATMTDLRDAATSVVRGSIRPRNDQSAGRSALTSHNFLHTLTSAAICKKKDAVQNSMTIFSLVQAAEKQDWRGIDLILPPQQQNNRQEQQRSAAAPQHRAECQ